MSEVKETGIEISSACKCAVRFGTPVWGLDCSQDNCIVIESEQNGANVAQAGRYII